jgi:hypothetical protein
MMMHHMLGQSLFDIAHDETWGEASFVMHAIVAGHTVKSPNRTARFHHRDFYACGIEQAKHVTCRPRQ